MLVVLMLNVYPMVSCVKLNFVLGSIFCHLIGNLNQ